MADSQVDSLKLAKYTRIENAYKFSAILEVQRGINGSRQWNKFRRVRLFEDANHI